MQNALTAKMELAQDRLGKPLVRWLREGVRRGWSANDIAHELARETGVRVTPESIRDWRRRLGVTEEKASA